MVRCVPRYVALLDPAALGRSTHVFVEITLQSQAEELLDAFEAVVADYERLHRTRLAQLPGVATLHSSFAIRAVHSGTAHRLPA